MNNIKKALTTGAVIGLLTCNMLWAQVDLNRILPPSPDAASLGKFAEIPVGHYTGIPNINMPVWQLSNGPLNVDIGLSYHAAGVKVEEIASCVGLNWSLDAGGAITRSVVGLPDDLVKPGRRGFLRYAEDLPYPIEDITLQSGEDRWVEFTQYVDGCIDTESDIYYFNFNGATGKFSFDWDGNIVVGSDKKVEIVPTYDPNDPVTRITQWTIRGEDGTTYVFAARENTTQENVSEQSAFNFCSGRPQTYTSSWYLTSVISANLTDTITFEYTDYMIHHGFTESESFSHMVNLNPANGCPGSLYPLMSSSFSTLVTNGKRIQQITSSNGYLVEFKKDDNAVVRTDVSGTNLYSIDEILIRHKGNLVNKFKLSYDYSDGGRLKLRALQEKGAQNASSKPAHEFIYNATELPPRDSKKQDYWGFYNSNTASHLVPPLGILAMTGEYVFFPGANRDPDSVKMKAGILEKIIYPTGGSTTFKFEPHQYGYVQANDVAGLKIPTFTNEIMFVGKAGDFVHTWSIDTLEITYKTVAEVQVGFSEPPLLGDLQDWYPKVKITNLDGTPVFLRNFHQGPVTTSFLLFPGKYIVGAYAFANDGTRADEAMINVFWKKPVDIAVSKKNLMAGGLRIKSIRYHDGIGGNPDIVDHFSYVMRDDSTKSSGVLMGEIHRMDDFGISFDLAGRLPMFVHEYGTVIQNGVDCSYLNRFSTNRCALGSTNGSHIAYREVVQFKTAEVSGKTIFVFDSPYEHTDGIHNAFPFPPAVTVDYKRGLLKHKLIYRYNQGNYELMQQENYGYSYPARSVMQLKVGRYSHNLLPSDTEYRYVLYPSNIGYSLPLSREILTRNDQTHDFLTTTEQYTYGNVDKQLKTVSTRDSRGRQLVTSYSHPQDFISLNNTIVNALIGKHIYNPVLKQEQLTNGTLTSGTITEYTNTGRLLLPSKMLAFESPCAGVAELSESVFSNRNYKTRQLYHAYDTRGNLLDFSDANNMHTSLIWGYDATHVVAKVTNAVPSEVFYTSFEDDITNIYNEGLTGGKSSSNGLSKLVTGLSNGMYRLTYWKKENNAWHFFAYDAAVTQNTYAISLTGQIDEVRFYPKQAQVTSYTYFPGYGVSSISDPNGEILFYDYDDLRRLSTIKNTKKEIVKTFQYFYHNQ